MERFPQPEKAAKEPVTVATETPPDYHTETVAVYPAEENHLPYDVIIETLHIDEPEPPSLEEAMDGNPISVQVNGEWQTFPNREAAETAMYEEYKENLRRNAENFRITDDDLGVGGAKAKFRMNMDAICQKEIPEIQRAYHADLRH